jgi:hypothetical protein
MAIAQGINKQLIVRTQTGLGSVGSATAQKLRRETASFNLTKSTFENKEIASHQQSTGATHGLRQTSGTISALLSGTSYNMFFQALLKGTYAAPAMTGMTGLGLTVAASGSNYTLTIASGSYLTAGLKDGDVIRITAGSGNADTKDKNLLIIAVTSATVLTVRVVNGSTMTVGAATAATIAYQGKKCFANPTPGAQTYFAIEEWFSDISVSDYYTDTCVGSVDIGLPSEGNATLAWNFAGLEKTQSGSQQLTGATAETTTPVLTAVNGVLIANGAVIGNVTGLSIKVDCAAANMGAVVGSDNSPDVQRGRIAVSGQMTAFFEGVSLTSLYDAATVIALHCVVASSQDANASFVSFTLPALKLSSDNKDDGEKGLIQTIAFTAEIKGTGGAGTGNEKTIFSTQDSLA